MELKQLEYFRTVALTGSFSQASAKLLIVQPALSRQIGKLEEEIGTKLFYRNGRGVTLTEHGRRFYDVAERLLKGLETICTELRNDGRVPHGSVTLGMPPSISAMMGASLLLRLRASMPGIKLHIIDGLSGHICEWLLSGKIDMGIIHDSRQSNILIQENFLSEPLYVVGQPSEEFGLSMPCDTFGEISMVELAGLPLVLQGQNHGLRRLIDKVAGEAKLELSIEIEVDALAAIEHLIQSEKLYSVMPIGSAVSAMQSSQTCAWRIDDQAMINKMLFATVPNKPFTAAMAEVHKALQVEVNEARLRGYTSVKMQGRTHNFPVKQAAL